MKKSCLVVALTTFFCLLPLKASAFEVGARGSYWFPKLDGTVKIDGGGVVGTELDLQNDLGLDEDPFLAVELFVGAGKHHLSVAYTNVDYSGKNILTRDIVFNGQFYTVSDEVTSSLDYHMLDVFYQYDFLDIDTILAGFSVGGVAHVKYLDGDLRLKTTTLDEQEDFSGPVPMVGLNAHIGLLADILEARVRGTGMAYSGNSMVEILGEISWTPFPLVDIHGGYKTFVTNVDEDDVFFDYNMSGAYVMVTVSF